MESVGCVSEPFDRCRLMLAAGPGICDLADLANGLRGGDVAAVILRDNRDNAIKFAEYCNKAVELIQASGAAALIADDTQIMGRFGADGLYLQGSLSTKSDMIARFSPQKIVGCGGILDRDAALKVGELYPDFVVLGKLGGDIKPEPHPKNLSIARWWAEFVELPGVTLGGNSVESVIAVSETGVDFVLLEKAVFAGKLDPEDAVRHSNQLLDQNGPRFTEASQ